MNDFEQTLKSILYDVQSHKRDRNELKKMYIQERLSKSLMTYYSETEDSIQYLTDKDGLNLMRKLNRIEAEQQ